MDEKLRTEIKLLKALQGITYKELAELLEIKTNSFYSWLNNNYDLGEEKETLLQVIADNLTEV